MQTISNNMRSLLRQGAPVTTTLTITEAAPGIQTITILPEDQWLDGTSIRRSCSSGKGFNLGGAEASELTATIINDGGKYDNFTFEGAHVEVLITVGAESINGGIFAIDERPAQDELMQIKAFDNIARFMREYDSNLIYPATVNQILQDACNKCSVTLDSTVNNGAFLVSTRPEEATYQEVVRWCAEIAGGFAYCDETGALKIGSYDTVPVEVLDSHYTLKHAENNVTVTGITYEIDDDIYIAGTDIYTVDVSDNQLLTDNPADGILLINQVVSGLTWRPASDLEVVPLPHVWPGDMLEVAENGKTYNLLVTDHNCNITQVSEMVSSGEPETLKGYATAAPLTSAQRRTITKISRNIARTETNALEQETLNLFNTMTGALGYHQTTVESESGTITYIHDQPALEESMMIATVTDQGWASTTTGWNNGMPAWTYGATFDGSLVMRVVSTVGLNAERIILTEGKDAETKFAEITAGQAIFRESLSTGGSNLLVNPSWGGRFAPDVTAWYSGLLVSLMLARFADMTMDEVIAVIGNLTIAEVGAFQW